MAEVRGTKELLETQSLIDYIEDVTIEKDSFQEEKTGRAVDYNYILVHLANGDTLRIKPDKVNKASIWFALKEGKKAV
jgi:hypothetical protein